MTLSGINLVTTEKLDLADFKRNPNNYTIVDIRNTSEVEEGKFFESAISHPLNELRDTANKIPTDKPIVVHCAGGYRSAAGSSIIQKKLSNVTVYDLHYRYCHHCTLHQHHHQQSVHQQQQHRLSSEPLRYRHLRRHKQTVAPLH